MKNPNRFYFKNGVILPLTDEKPADYLLTSTDELDILNGVAYPGSIARVNGKEYQLDPDGNWEEKAGSSQEEIKTRIRFYVKDGKICPLGDNQPAEYYVATANELANLAALVFPGAIAYVNGDRYELGPNGEWDKKASGGGGGGGGASSMEDLDDVNISNPTNGQVLVYDSANDEWKNANGGSGGASAVEDLTDVAITQPTNGQVLSYDSTTEKWINQSVAGAVLDPTLTIPNASADAKAVGDHVFEIENLTLEQKTERHIDNILPLLTWTDGKVMPASGSSGNAGSYCYSNKIAVIEGDTFAADHNMHNVCAFSGDTVVPSAGTDVSGKTYVVPAGIDGVIISYAIANRNAEGEKINHTYIRTHNVNIYEDDITELQEKMDPIINESIPPYWMDGVTLLGHNILEDAIQTWPGYYISSINSTTRKVSIAANDSYNTYLIPVKSKVYNISGTSGTVRFRYYTFVDGPDRIAIPDATIIQNVTSMDCTTLNPEYAIITLYNSIGNPKVIPDGEPTTERYHVAGKYEFEDLESSPSIHAYLPPEICVAVGRTIELYNHLVCLEDSKYHVNWVCDTGVAYCRKFTVVGTNGNVGNHTLKFQLYDDDLGLVKELTSVIKVVEPSINSQIKVVPIGDSLTNGKLWITEVQNLSSDMVHYIGTRGPNSDSTKRHEGRSGATAAWYLGDNTYTFDSNYQGNPSIDGTANPFWDATNSKFSFQYYLANQEAYIGTPGAVQILLGINGISSNPTNNVNNIMTIVNTIKQEYPNMPVFVCNTIYKSKQDGYYSTGNDGYAATSGFEWQYDLYVMRLQIALSEAISDAGYSDVYVVPCSVCMDRDNNFGQVEVPVNPRLTTVTTTIPNEAVHPREAGHLQMADVMYSSFAAHLSN